MKAEGTNFKNGQCRDNENNEHTRHRTKTNKNTQHKTENKKINKDIKTYIHGCN